MSEQKDYDVLLYALGRQLRCQMQDDPNVNSVLDTYAACGCSDRADSHCMYCIQDVNDHVGPSDVKAQVKALLLEESSRE